MLGKVYTICLLALEKINCSMHITNLGVHRDTSVYVTIVVRNLI